MNSQVSSDPQADAPTIDTVDASCEKHGSYAAKIIPMLPGMPSLQTKCPECLSDARQQSAVRDAEQKQRDEALRISWLFHRSGIPARFSDRTLAGYRASTEGQKRALKISERFVASFVESKSAGVSLVFAGKPGTGKTHLACGIAHALMKKLQSAQFMTVLQALRHIKDTYRRDSERSESDAINDLLRPDLLILDEIGVQLGSEHEKMLLFEIINERYQQCLSTILISNLTSDELTQFLGDRVMDRFRESGAIVAFDWDSHRGRSAA